MEQSEHIISTGWVDLKEESADTGAGRGCGGSEASCNTGVVNIAGLRERAIREDLFRKEREEELLKGRQDYLRRAARRLILTLEIKTSATLKELETMKEFFCNNQRVEIIKSIVKK